MQLTRTNNIQNSSLPPCTRLSPMSGIYNSLPCEYTGPRAFSLLQISPSSDSRSPVETRLFNASLDGSPMYDALLYSWAGSGNNRCVIFNGAKILVLDNLYSAMVQLRQQNFPKTGTFWIDSICVSIKPLFRTAMSRYN